MRSSLLFGIFFVFERNQSGQSPKLTKTLLSSEHQQSWQEFKCIATPPFRFRYSVSLDVCLLFTRFRSRQAVHVAARERQRGACVPNCGITSRTQLMLDVSRCLLAAALSVKTLADTKRRGKTRYD